MIVLDAFGNPVVGGPDIASAYSVENTAALRLFTVAPAAGTLVATLGDVTQDDGNGGFWFWVPNSTETDDGVTVVKCTALFAGRFYRYAAGQVITIPDGSVTTAKLVNSAVTNAKIADASVTTAKIADLNVTTGKIAAGAVTTAKIAAGAVTATELGTGAVGSTQLASSAVTTAKITDANVTLAKMANLAANTVIGSSGGGVPAALTMTSAGRAMAAASDAAAQRTLLSLTDVTDEASAELAHANSVCSFTYPSVSKVFRNNTKIGTLGNDWTLLTGGSGALGNSGKGVATSGWAGGGGANILTTGATASSYVQLISCVNGLAILGGAMIDNLVSATAKWHFETVFKISTTPNSNTEIGVGWVDSGGGDQLLVGVRGAQSTTKFRVFKGGTSTGANSTVSIDTNPHRFRMWGNGDGKVYFSVDYESAIQLSGATWADTVAAPYVTVQNGSTAAAQTVYLSTARYRVDGVVA